MSAVCPLNFWSHPGVAGLMGLVGVVSCASPDGREVGEESDAGLSGVPTSGPPLQEAPDSGFGRLSRLPLDLTGALGPDPLEQHCSGTEPGTHAAGTLAELVSVINELPKPLSIACLLRALERPLSVSLAQSLISAQPASGAHNPRIFIFLEDVIVALVPRGIGRHLFEMSEPLDEIRSVKAELVFPILKEVELAEAYEEIFSGNITTCAQCHANETEIQLPGGQRAFVTDALRPHANRRVPISTFAREVKDCDLYLDGERCAMIHAMFLYGPVTEAEFPETFATFGAE